MGESSANGSKTRWEKEKLLVTSNFSFSPSVFKRLVLQTRKNQGLFGKGLIFPCFMFKNFTIIIHVSHADRITRTTEKILMGVCNTIVCEFIYRNVLY